MDRSEPPATIGVLMSAAADEASLALALDWGRTLLTHLHSASWHEGERLSCTPTMASRLGVGPTSALRPVMGQITQGCGQCSLRGEP